MKIGVIGGGSVGGFVGAAMAKRGHAVTIAVRGADPAPPTRTIHVESRLLGEFEATVDLASRLEHPFDVIFVAVRAFQLPMALGALDPAGTGDATVVPLMNGIDHVDVLRELVGADRVMAGTIRVEVERADGDHIRQLTPFADVQLGPNIANERRSALAEAFTDAGFACVLADDERTVLWTKLAMLAPLALATSAAGGPIGAVRSEPDWNARLVACCTEACAVARADGATVSTERVLATLAGLPDEMRSSMQKDLAAGRPLETDAIGGAVRRHGLAHGIATPATTELLELVATRAGSPGDVPAAETSSRR